ncbi:MAG: sugar phosphate nucleotidyltransferase [Myxococcota bacterium]|nr:sugar phosphate nucleotidyltransferase [Myxococcota bacterium]
MKQPAVSKRPRRHKSQAKSAPSLHAVILAGGAGERFWPASRKKHPKPLMRVVGGASLLAETLGRAHKFAGSKQVWIVCGKEHARAIRRESGLPANRVLVEPRRRNTAMAVAWAAQRIAAEDPDAVMAILSADHHIPDARAFASSIKRCAKAASGSNVLLTLGIKPTRPDTGYGYIQQGKSVDKAFPGVCGVRRFVEKPDAARAQRYMASGRYLWNAGVFVFAAETLLAEVKACAPDLHRALAPLRKEPKGRNAGAVAAAYRRAPSLPIDVAVMERSENVWTLPVDFAWSDVGTWSSLAEELGVGKPGGSGNRGRNRVVAGDVVLEDSSSNLVWGGERTIALLGVEGLAVIDTGDAILISQLDSSHEVRKVVATLGKRGRKDLT